jgi:hypothetical protein
VGDDSVRSFMVELISTLNKSTTKQELLKTWKTEQQKKFPKHEVGNFLNMLEGLKAGHPDMTPELKSLVKNIKPEEAVTAWET